MSENQIRLVVILLGAIALSYLYSMKFAVVALCIAAVWGIAAWLFDSGHKQLANWWRKRNE